MEITDFYTLVVVPDPPEVRDWYVRHLNFTVAVDAEWTVFLTSPGSRPFGVCFMREGLEHQRPQFQSRLTGSAAILTIEVADAEAALREVEATGATPEIPLVDEPWGQRHFMLRDPSGLWVDIVQMIDPSPGFYDDETRDRLAALATPWG